MRTPRPETTLRSETLQTLALVSALALSACDSKKKATPGSSTNGQDPAIEAISPPPEPELPELEPGRAPVDFQAEPSVARPGEFALFARRLAIREQLADSEAAPSFTFVAGSVARVDGPDVVMRARRPDGSEADEERVPASLVVPMGPPAKAAPGELVLTWSPARSSMRRALVLEGGSPERPLVALLDDDTTIASAGEPTELAAGSFRVVREPLDPGAWVTVPRGSSRAPAMILARAGESLLLRGFGGVLFTAPADGARPASRGPHAVGDAVLAPYLGRLVPARVVETTPRGRVVVSLEFGPGATRSVHHVGTLSAPRTD